MVFIIPSNSIPVKIDDCRALFIEIFKNSMDFRTCDFESISGRKILIVYINGLINNDILNRDIITPLKNIAQNRDVKDTLNISSIRSSKDINDITDSILEGCVVLFLENPSSSYIIDLKNWKDRAIEQPDAEAVIRGPKEGFIESINVNISLIRRKIKNSNLVFEELKLGSQTKTKISIAYIEGIVDKEVLNEVRTRLGKISYDSILETGYIEQFIEDNALSPLPTIGNTQKPDVVAAKLLEGRAAILCDGTPHVLTVPYLFIESLQTSEDYYTRPYLATFLRFLRMLALFISVFLPGLYVSLQTFHQEMIPTVLLITMAGAREGIPLPTFAEALLMVIAFELLKESGIRLPRPIGSAMSIVGALILGEAAVNAGLVSAAMVIVVASTAVSSFILPNLVEAITFYRFLFLILGGIMGIYGITCGLVLVVVQAVSLRSFSVPYLTPLSPFDLDGMKDYGIRIHLDKMKKRPKFLAKNNRKRI